MTQFAHQPVNTAPQAISLQGIASIHASAPSERVSERYGFIPTSTIVTALEHQGFIPVGARAARARPDRAPFAMHTLRFRHRTIWSSRSAIGCRRSCSSTATMEARVTGSWPGSSGWPV